MTHDYQGHLDRPQADERENDEEAEVITQEDVDLAEQDLRDREDDFVAALNGVQNALREGVVKKTSLTMSAAKWFRQQCDAEDEESDAFRDLVVCGMGWTETRLDYEDNPEGDPKVDRSDPLEMVWDSGAKKRNLVDGRRLAHISSRERSAA
jgi:hypothetical protein